MGTAVHVAIRHEGAPGKRKQKQTPGNELLGQQEVSLLFFHLYTLRNGYTWIESVSLAYNYNWTVVFSDCSIEFRKSREKQLQIVCLID